MQFREKLEDPQYAGFWLKFDNATNDETLTPRCAHNSRLNRTLCSDLFHSPLRWTTDGNDCTCLDNLSVGYWTFENHFG